VTVQTVEAQLGWIEWLEENLSSPTTAEPVVPSAISSGHSTAPPLGPAHLTRSCILLFPGPARVRDDTKHRARFVADVQAVTVADTPLLFQRSEWAWRTHPANYREIEGMATYVAGLLLGCPLDLTWCHLAIQAGGSCAGVAGRAGGPT